MAAIWLGLSVLKLNHGDLGKNGHHFAGGIHLLQRHHQICALLALRVRNPPGNRLIPSTNGQQTRKAFPCHDVIMA